MHLGAQFYEKTRGAEDMEMEHPKTEMKPNDSSGRRELALAAMERSHGHAGPRWVGMRPGALLLALAVAAQGGH